MSGMPVTILVDKKDGEVCHTPKELFNLLADDYRTYVEIELTKGKREVTEDDEREADAPVSYTHLDVYKRQIQYNPSRVTSAIL